jgi:hypothetical protein
MKQYVSLTIAAAMLAACGGNNNMSGASASNSGNTTPSAGTFPIGTATLVNKSAPVLRHPAKQKTLRLRQHADGMRG